MQVTRLTWVSTVLGGIAIAVLALPTSLTLPLATSQPSTQALSAHTFTVSVDDVSQSEGDTRNAFDFEITVTRDLADALSSADLTVNWQTEEIEGTATPTDDCANGGDFERMSGSHTFSLGAGATEDSHTVPVWVCGDLVDEPDKTFFLHVTSDAGSATAQGTIENDDAPVVWVEVPRLPDGTPGRWEGDSGLTNFPFTVEFRHPRAEDAEGQAVLTASRVPLTVAFWTEDGDHADADRNAFQHANHYRRVLGDNDTRDGFSPTAAPLHFAPGDTSKTFTVPVVGNTTDEHDKDFIVRVEVIEPPVGEGEEPEVEPVEEGWYATILNDDDPFVLVSDAMVAEGAFGQSPRNQMEFTVSLSHPSNEDITVRYRTRAGEGVNAAKAGDHYEHTEGELTIDHEEGVATVTVPVIGNDTPNDGDRRFYLDLVEITSTDQKNPRENVNATIHPTQGSGTGTILDDDSKTPVLHIDDVTEFEGDEGETTPFVFTVSLLDPQTGGPRPTRETVTVEYETQDGTATASTDDYEPISGTLTFPPGELTQEITVNVIGDEFPGPNEEFYVVLANPENATIGKGTGVGKILNDDGPVIYAWDTEVEPDATEAVFEVYLHEHGEETVTVDYATADGTAIAGTHYGETSGTLAFPPGGSKDLTVTVPILTDAIDGELTFDLVFSDEVGATLAQEKVTATLQGSATAASGRSLEHACPGSEVSDPGFTDVHGNTHRFAIECVAWWGVTTGRTATSYEPGGTVSRGQMASFIARTIEASGVELPASPAEPFSDVSGTTHAERINQIAELGVVSGFPDGTYRPGAPVTRAQMATFLANAYEAVTGAKLQAGSSGHFSDTSGSSHEASINAVARAGIALGRSDGTYGPSESVRRGQMASFIARLLDLLVDEEHAAPPSENGNGEESSEDEENGDAND